MKISAKFKPQDLWVGAYWERTPAWVDPKCRTPKSPHPAYHRPWALDIWVCLVPMLPVKFHFGPAKGRGR